MKKLKVLFVAIMASCCALPASAQLKFGVEGGLNASKVSVDHFNAKNRTGWFIGPKVQFSVPVVGFAIDGALLYSQKYLQVDSQNELGETATIKQDMPCLDLPINFKYNIGFSSLIGVYVSTGPQYSWNLGKKSLYSDDEQYGSLEASSFSWNVGVGVNALKVLQVGVTYNIALGKTGEVENLYDAATTAKLKNNTWQVRLACMF
ncbi:porin family protein [Bacteroides eggerthii]|uniref:Porin family protein n=1 Tax=Bacteroides eggerthii TaxID=28111 RepID=A0ABT7U5V6_9BACE|nr:porin family protein [Bacteroides eggerthii]